MNYVNILNPKVFKTKIKDWAKNSHLKGCLFNE